jgi:hypothetical protein
MANTFPNTKLFLIVARLALAACFLSGLFVPVGKVLADGAAGYALSFDGVDDFVLLDETIAIIGPDWKSTKSVSLWVKPEGPVPSCGIGDVAWCDNIFGDRPRWWGISRGVVGGQDRIWVWNYGNGMYSKIGIPYTANEWVHIAAVHEGGMLKAYKNGLLVGSIASGATDSPFTGANPVLQIGAVINTADRNWSFQGQIDEVRVYNIGLSQTDIRNSLMGELAGNEPGLAAYYKMSNGSGTIVTDNSIHDWNGTIKDNIASLSGNGQFAQWVSSGAFDTPLADNLTVSAIQNTTTAVQLSGISTPGASLTYTYSDPPHGTLSGTAPALTYTPDSGYTGADSFTYQVWNGSNSSADATVSITVYSTNNTPPVANTLNISTNVNTAVGITLTGSDANNDPLTFSVVSNPSHGNLSGTPPNLTYIPNVNYTGSDSFTYKANDGLVDSSSATVSINIAGSNSPPVVTAQNIETNEDTSVSFVLNANDPEGSALTYTFTSPPTEGTLSGTAPNMTYIPNPNYNGIDRFSYFARDEQSNRSITVTVTITIHPMNDAPTRINQSLTTGINVPLPITLTANDIDGDPLTFEIINNPQHGALGGATPNLVYTPNTNFSGTDIFSFRAYDGQAYSQTANVIITVSGESDTPLAQADTYFVDRDSILNVAVVNGVLSNDISPQGVPLQAVLEDDVSHGTLAINSNGSFTYTPDNGFSGEDSFTYYAIAGVEVSNTVTVKLFVGASKVFLPLVVR